MHPKAHEILVNYERNKRAEISRQLAKLAVEFEKSLTREMAIPPPTRYIGASGRLHPVVEAGDGVS